MKTNDRWDQLTRWARLAPKEDKPVTAPFGFATRVAARWAASEPVSAMFLWERLSLRSLAVAAFIMLASLCANYDLLAHSWMDVVSEPDAVLETVLDQ